jgi:hypothetical protein
MDNRSEDGPASDAESAVNGIWHRSFRHFFFPMTSRRPPFGSVDRNSLEHALTALAKCHFFGAIFFDIASTMLCLSLENAH